MRGRPVNYRSEGGSFPIEGCLHPVTRERIVVQLDKEALLRRFAYSHVDREHVLLIQNTLQDPTVVAAAETDGSEYWLYIGRPFVSAAEGPTAMSVYVRPTGFRAYAFGQAQVQPPDEVDGTCMPLQYDGRIKQVLYRKGSPHVSD